MDNHESFEQFWDFYVAAHANKTNRVLHFVGTSAAMGCILGGLLTKRRWLLLLAPVVGYGPAWIGHFFFEGNRPASFDHPLWSLRADLLMWYKTLTGSMRAEVDRVVAESAATRPAAAENGAPVANHVN